MADAAGDAENCGRITAVLASGAALCATCLANRTGIPENAVERLILRIRRTLRIELGGRPCDSCRTTLLVYGLE